MKILVMLIGIALVTNLAYGFTQVDQGFIIATESYQRYSGFGDSYADMEMTLITKQGDRVSRKLKIQTLEHDSLKSDKTLFSFTFPNDIRGTALLTWSYTEQPDKQWLYLPKIKRVKAISSSNKAGSFIGSEFSYEDMTPQKVEKFTYKYLKNEACGKLNCFVLIRFPKSKNSGYTKEILWVDNEEYLIQKIHYFDRKATHSKTLIISDYKKYNDKYWRASTMTMSNNITGRYTILSWNKYKFNLGLSDMNFTTNSLKRSR
ncbi:MAG: outer membrane lipoprotein-sorting protein [Colwellia sp.]|nr:outer membrane lipoprotein-sorting protein [Colwellia sp.]